MSYNIIQVVELLSHRRYRKMLYSDFNSPTVFGVGAVSLF